MYWLKNEIYVQLKDILKKTDEKFHIKKYTLRDFSRKFSPVAYYCCIYIYLGYYF